MTEAGRNRAIFLAFGGTSIDQEENIVQIGSGYECWNLQKFTADDFVSALQGKIPPVNETVVRSSYMIAAGTRDTFGITDTQFTECSWGLLIQDSLEDAIGTSYSEAIFLINLYSPAFLYPVFYAGDMGILRPPLDRTTFELAQSQNQATLFKTKNFVTFFKTMLPQSQYGTWMLYRAQKWAVEDWRLFVAGMLFSGLREYDNKKTAFGWQRESADMGATLEALFTAGDSQNEEVGYRLRKRIAVLLSSRFPSIEKDIKKLYAQRSAFVHGDFFAQIARESRGAFSNLPIPDFQLLYRQKEYVRWALVAYLRLAQLVKSQPGAYGGATKVIQVLESAIIDIELRRKVLEDIDGICSLLPKSDGLDGSLTANLGA